MTGTGAGVYAAELTTCVWELTLRCNARCRLCGSSAPRARPGELSLRRCRELAAEMVDLGLRSVTMSGGEPLLKEGFDTLVADLVAAGVRTDVVSNGLLIDDERARQLVDLGLYGVTVSFDGPEAVHDELRGVRGGYGRAMRAVASLVRAGMRVGVITHVNRTNLPHLDDLAPALADAGVHTWRLQLTIPVDDVPETHDEILEPDQLPDVVALIRRVNGAGRLACRGSHSIGYFGDGELDLRRWSASGPRVWSGCSAGLGSIGLTSDGDVMACLSLLTHGARFIEGNVGQRSLTDIWRDPRSFPATRAFDPAACREPCATCRFLERCRAGCLCLLAAVDPELRGNGHCLYAVERARAVPGERAAARAPSVVVLVVDGLRADATGCCGADGDGGRTPALDALAAGGLVAPRARTGAPWTAPSVAALVTGVSPHRMGIARWQQPYGPAEAADLFTLAAERGYAVGSFTFDGRHLFRGAPQARVVGRSWALERLADWMLAHVERPSLTYVHWWGTHAPYLARPMGWRAWREAMARLLAALDRDRRFGATLRELYLRAVEHADGQVLGRVVRAIEESRGWDDTILVVCGDHGESWGERHGPDEPIRDILDLHGRSLHEEILRVPLVIAGAVEPREIGGVADLTDVVPTVAALAGWERPPGAGWDGVDLTAGVPPGRVSVGVATRDLIDAAAVPGDAGALYTTMTAVAGTDKLWWDPPGGRLRWFELADDPGERRDGVAAGRTPPAPLVEALRRAWEQAGVVGG